MQCPTCHNDIAPTDRFCRHCGAALAPEAPKQPSGSATLADLVAQFGKTLADAPEDVTTQYNLALALLYQGNYREAAAHLAAVVEKEPEFADAYEKLAIALHRLGDIPGAISALERAVALDPDNTRLRSALIRLSRP